MSGPFGATTPVLVGVGTASQKCEDHTDAAEPLELMRRALAAAAGDDAVLESGSRTRHGLGLDESRDRIARLYGRFSEVATSNPDAW